VSCGVGRRHGSDPALLWLWRRPVATAPIQPLAWEPPYATGAAQEIATTTKRQKIKNKKKIKNSRTKNRGTKGWSTYGEPFLPFRHCAVHVCVLFNPHDGTLKK